MKTLLPKRKSILAIEAERPFLAVVKQKFENIGFDVITAHSVDEVFSATLNLDSSEPITAKALQQALEYLDALEHLDAIWLNHILVGKENGIDFVKKLKANGETWQNIPIFIVSDSQTATTIQSYTHLGVRKYYTKKDHILDEIIADINYSLCEQK